MASFVHRIEVHYKKDPRQKIRTDRIRSLGFPIDELQLVDVYTIAIGDRDMSPGELAEIGTRLTNPVVQEFVVDRATRTLFDSAIEVGFLPGVTDNVGTTARQTIEDFLGIQFGEGETVSSSELYFVRGRLAPDVLARLAATLANPLVNRVNVKSRAGVRGERDGPGRPSGQASRAARCRDGGPCNPGYGSRPNRKGRDM